MKKCALLTVTILCILLSLALTGCGLTSALAPAPEPTATPEPTPEPTPTPTPEPSLSAGYVVTVDGKELAGGSYMLDGVECVSLLEFADAVGVDVTESDGRFTFLWRDDEVKLTEGSIVLFRGMSSYTLECAPFVFRGALYVPVESLCEALDISLYFDEEFDHMYCTPGAGDWELLEGYKVPVFMYHCVSVNTPGADLYVWPEDMEAQMQYLLDNGYDPIWFEDLEHVDDYDKPVILTYDDGYADNYTELFPIAKKLNVKITICMITSCIDMGGYLFSEQIKEMVDSGLVAIESHTVNHLYLNELGTGWQESEMRDSELALVRLTGKEPVMICYPTGCSNEITYEMTAKYYRFGMKMTGPCYVTGDDPTIVWRVFIKGTDGLNGFVNRLNEALA